MLIYKFLNQAVAVWVGSDLSRCASRFRKEPAGVGSVKKRAVSEGSRVLITAQ